MQQSMLYVVDVALHVSARCKHGSDRLVHKWIERFHEPIGKLQVAPMWPASQRHSAAPDELTLQDPAPHSTPAQSAAGSGVGQYPQPKSQHMPPWSHWFRSRSGARRFAHPWLVM